MTLPGATPNHKNSGAQFEQAAETFLTKQGVSVVCRNWRCKGGEIDLIADTKNRELLIIEVKYRTNSYYGSAAEQVTVKKQQRLIHSANLFLSKNRSYKNYSVRFDVIAITSRQNELQFAWIKNAFY